MLVRILQILHPMTKDLCHAGQLVNAYPWMAIREDPIDWQLRVFGEHMDRSFDSKPDSRVRFDPDKWQRDVLDKLDKDESVLVVAPTRYAYPRFDLAKEAYT